MGELESLDEQVTDDVKLPSDVLSFEQRIALLERRTRSQGLARRSDATRIEALEYYVGELQDRGEDFERALLFLSVSVLFLSAAVYLLRSDHA